MKRKRRRRIFAVVLLLIAGAVITWMLLPIHFWYTPPFGKVRKENKEFFKALYQEHKEDFAHMDVAEDSRSYACHRVVIYTKNELSENSQKALLGEIESHMNFLVETGVYAATGTWELYLCYDGDVYRAYHYTSANELGWEAMPDDVLKQLDRSKLRQLLRSIMRPVYDMATTSITEREPDLPPYDHNRK